MKILLTLDYELFLGQDTGSIENCLIKPMSLLSDALLNYGRFTIFVDATYLLRLSQLASKYYNLQEDFDRLVDHIGALKIQGHDIQLHIHPHWTFSNNQNGNWISDTDHYKLKDLSVSEAIKITHESKEMLEGIIGNRTTIFRAGGFSAQPTQLLKDIFNNTGLVADSSVIPGSFYYSRQQEYDYRKAPSEKTIYRFEDDICIETPNGRFTEIPISMYNVSPFFHWKLVFNRLFKQSKHIRYGDGISVKTTKDSIISRLLWWQCCHTTIDGYKINFLKKAYRQAKNDDKDAITVLGHPKLATPFSIKELSKFAKMVVENGDEILTISDYLHEQNS